MRDEQLRLFEPTKEEILSEVYVAKEQISNLRKGLFRRYSEMVSELSSLKEQIEELSEKISEEK